jgi:hypothetical protein
MEWKKHLIVFLITAGIFSASFILSNKINSQKIDVIREAKDKVAIDILSTETRYALLSASSCEYSIQDNNFETTLTEDLNNLARKLKFIESQLGSDNENVIIVKRQYAILQIKDYLLVRELAKRCNEHLMTILYFHSDDCAADCRNQSTVLDKLHEIFPEIRIYWLDQGLDDPTMNTLVSMLKIEKSPSLIINEKKHSGFQELDALIKALPKDLQKRYTEINQASEATEKSTTKTQE